MVREAWTRPTRRFTVDQYERMGRTGVLHEDDRVELIEGEIVEMAAVGSRHMACVTELHAWFVTALGSRARVSSQNPVRLPPLSMPEPDLMLLRPRPDRYFEALPGPEDVLLVVEVSDTTLAYDRRVKLPLYAAAGIPEAWILDLRRPRALVFRAPVERAYTETAIVPRDGALTPRAFPDLVLPLVEVLPPRAR